MKSSMDGQQTRLFSGCRGLLVLSALLVLHLTAFGAHGSSLWTNVTEPSNQQNSSSLPPSGEAEQMDMTPGVTGSAPPIVQSQQMGRKSQGNGELGSGMLGGGAISLDSAEMDQVLEAGVVPPFLPTPRRGAGTQIQLDFQDTDDHQQREHTDPPWLAAQPSAVATATVPSTTTGAPTMPGLGRQPATAVPLGWSPVQPDVVTVAFLDPGSHRRQLDTAVIPEPAANELQAGEPTSWATFDTYDYLTPSDILDEKTALPTDSSTSTTMEDQDILSLSSTPPSRTFDPRAVGSLAPSDMHPTEPDEDEVPPPAPGVVDSINGSYCRPGYMRHNATCRSLCDFFPSYCFNGGQCYLVEGTGVFCRCSVQDYIWHKGSRCESVVTEFQVMCMAVGVAAFMVLLLFMVTVCFAKKLHLLKTENRKLRRRSSKYRPASEQHNDNFSLSTIAEGSHPNVRKLCDTPPNPPNVRALAYYDNIICQDDPNTQNKLEDPVKVPPPKEDEPLNIQNSLTPKHENNKVVGEENSEEVNSLQNNMM